MPKKYFVLSIIFVLSFLLFPNFAKADNVYIYFYPLAGNFVQGESFWLQITVNAQGENINAVSAHFNYPEDKLEFLGIDTSSSVITNWTENNITSGRVEIGGILPSPGFSGVAQIARVGFKSKVSSGFVSLYFDRSSSAIRSSGGVNILNASLSRAARYDFKPSFAPLPESEPEVSPQAEPEQQVIPEENAAGANEMLSDDLNIKTGNITAFIKKLPQTFLILAGINILMVVFLVVLVFVYFMTKKNSSS